MIIIVPTEREARFLRADERVTVFVSGMGERCVEPIEELVEKYAAEHFVMVGTAGAFAGCGLELFDFVEVRNEFSPNGCRSCATAKPFGSLRCVDSLTVKKASDSLCKMDGEAEVENMEGSWFFELCNRRGVRCSELRIVSNFVGDDRSKWFIDAAARYLPVVLDDLLNSSDESGLNICRSQSVPLRLSISPCPNDTFMFYALLHSKVDTMGLRFEVDFRDIEVLNNRLLESVSDVSKVSAATIERLTDQYVPLDSGAAMGFGNGPLLVAAEGREINLSDSRLRVAVPGMHTTACMLLRRFYPALTDLNAVLFSDIARAVACGAYDCGVLIHEGRFTYRDHGLKLLSDLGAEWESATQQPLPLGAIVASRKLSEGVIRRVELALARSVAYAVNHPDEPMAFVRSKAQELDPRVMQSHINLFVNRFSISQTDQHTMPAKSHNG